jgi:hypothetical protein
MSTRQALRSSAVVRRIGGFGRGRVAETLRQNLSWGSVVACNFDSPFLLSLQLWEHTNAIRIQPGLEFARLTIADLVSGRIPGLVEANTAPAAAAAWFAAYDGKVRGVFHAVDELLRSRQARLMGELRGEIMRTQAAHSLSGGLRTHARGAADGAATASDADARIEEASCVACAMIARCGARHVWLPPAYQSLLVRMNAVPMAMPPPTTTEVRRW